MGKWHQVEKDGKLYASVRDETGRCVADCGSRSDKAAQDAARLIAAAPELQAALEAMLEDSKTKTWCNQFDNGYTKWIPNAVESQAIEALKAIK